MVSSASQLLGIVEAVYADGGITFLKIRALLEGIDDLAKAGDSRALDFRNSLLLIHNFCKMAQEKEL